MEIDALAIAREGFVWFVLGLGISALRAFLRRPGD